MRYPKKAGRAVGCVAAAGIATFSMLAVGGAAGATSSRHRGGTVTIGSPPTPTVLDWTQTGFAQPGAAWQMEVFGSLFLQPTKPGGAYVPDLATSYHFNRAGTVFTMTLRHGVTFSDGSPFDAQAVVWNWSKSRDAGPLAFTNQYFEPVTSVRADGKYTVVVHFDKPNTVWISEIAGEPLGLMASRSALRKEGQNSFDLTPVGAGPFKVVQNVAGQTLILGRNPRYWNVKDVYLSRIVYKDTGFDPSADYTDLQSGAVNDEVFSGAITSPPIIGQALSNRNLAHGTTPNDTVYQMPVNTTVPPFNNLQAREALDYCLNRNVIAKDVLGGTASPAWVYAGPAETGYPQSGGKPSIDAAKKLMPYQYDPSKGTAIVKSLGGLTFKWSVLDLSTELVTIATAVQQEWSQCGINVNIDPVPPSQYNSNITSGTFQLGFNPSGGQVDPRLDTVYISAQSPLNSHGVKDPVVQAALTRSYAATTAAQIGKDWTTVWSQLDRDAVDIPLVSTSSYNVYNPCIRGTQYNYGESYLHAWLACGR